MTFGWFTGVCALLMGLSIAVPVSAQPSPAEAGAFLYDASGAVLGSVKSVQGDTAVVWHGFVRTPGNHLSEVKLSDIGSQGGRLVLNGATASTLAAR